MFATRAAAASEQKCKEVRSTHEIIPKPIPLPNPEPHPRSNRRSLRKLRTAVVERRRQRLKRRRRRSRVVVLHRSIHAVSRANGEPWHRAKAAMLVARSSHHRRRAASREERGAMRGTGQPLCSQTRTATCDLLSCLLCTCCSRAVAFAAAQLSAQGSVRAHALSTLRLGFLGGSLAQGPL